MKLDTSLDVLTMLAMLLKACLKAKEPQGLSALLGQSEAHFKKCALGMLFWCFLKMHKACLDTPFDFIAKKDIYS